MPTSIVWNHHSSFKITVTVTSFIKLQKVNLWLKFNKQNIFNNMSNILLFYIELIEYTEWVEIKKDQIIKVTSCDEENFVFCVKFTSVIPMYRIYKKKKLWKLFCNSSLFKKNFLNFEKNIVATFIQRVCFTKLKKILSMVEY